MIETDTTRAIETRTIQRDLADTEAEVTSLRRVIEAHETLAAHALDPSQRRMAEMRASRDRHGLAAREEFCEKLRGLLAERAAACGESRRTNDPATPDLPEAVR